MNLRITCDEVFDAISKDWRFLTSEFAYPTEIRYFGYPLVRDPDRDEFIVYEGCEYCERNNLGVDDKCKSCGAPAWW